MEFKEGYFIEKVILIEPEDPWIEGDFWFGYSRYMEKEDEKIYYRFWSSLEKFCCPMTGQFKNCEECKYKYPTEMEKMCKKSTQLMLSDGKIIEVYPIEWLQKFVKELPYNE